jgi:hypothetical protein
MAWYEPRHKSGPAGSGRAVSLDRVDTGAFDTSPRSVLVSIIEDMKEAWRRRVLDLAGSGCL